MNDDDVVEQECGFLDYGLSSRESFTHILDRVQDVIEIRPVEIAVLAGGRLDYLVIEL